MEVGWFKLPEEPKVRYIKRLVGLPEETIRMQDGDLWRRPHQADDPGEEAKAIRTARPAVRAPAGHAGFGLRRFDRGFVPASRPADGSDGQPPGLGRADGRDLPIVP